MARYIAKERGQIPADDIRPTKRADSSPGRRVLRMVEKGEEFEFHGTPGKWMEPVKRGQTDQGGSQEGNAQAGRRSTRTRTGQTDQGGSQAQTSQDGSEGAGPDSQ